MLDDLNILIVDDEAIIALDLAMMVEDCGAAVAGPCASIDQADAFADCVDAAILDVDLNGMTVFPLADRLARRGTPFMFHTGRLDLETLRRRYGNVPVIAKPATEDIILSALRSIVGREIVARAG